MSVRSIAADNRDQFSDGFLAWLADNPHIWERFVAEANAAWKTGRQHYSARTIWEYIRHETALRSKPGLPMEFKVNNNYCPDVARLYMLVYPARRGFFELRGRP